MPERSARGWRTLLLVIIGLGGCGDEGPPSADTWTGPGWPTTGNDATTSGSTDAGETSMGADTTTATTTAADTTATTTETGSDPSNGDRFVTITSECPGQTVVVGINGGFVQACGAGDACPEGTTCLVGAAGPVGCFWDFPSPSEGSPVLAEGESVRYLLSAPPLGNIKWSGNVYASTQCQPDGSGCQTAMCAVSKAGMTMVQPCASGVGPQGPTTLAEFTLQFDTVDFYDISLINGVNIPVAMGPDDGIADDDDPYTCQTAGATADTAGGLLGCSWSFDPSIELGGITTDRTTLLRAVAPGGTPCTTDGECTGGDVCGTALVFGATTTERLCGPALGWWTANELCIYTNDAQGAPVGCTDPVPGQGTVADLYGCDGFNPDSCYDVGGASPTCCGCPDWVIDGMSLPVPAGFSCVDTNPQWTALAEPWARFVKEACPTGYSFPFDDATSTFTCSTPDPSAGSPNTMGYTITLCPGGNDGT